MKLTEEIILTKPHYAPAGAPINKYLISDKPIDELINNLHKKGIEINSDYSEKEVRYSTKTIDGSFKEKEVIVPLLTKFSGETTLIAFYLRNRKGLELELQNYSNIISSPRKGVIGGSVAGNFGISCKISLEGITIEPSIVNKVKSAIEETYIKDDCEKENYFKKFFKNLEEK
jgi:hypothetical protein